MAIHTEGGTGVGLGPRGNPRQSGSRLNTDYECGDLLPGHGHVADVAAAAMLTQRNVEGAASSKGGIGVQYCCREFEVRTV